MTYWKRLLNWLENGDLVPWVILVSIPHYHEVLKLYEWWVAAAAIAVLVDLGHYRTIKQALAGRGWFWMFILTGVSYGFHVAFYIVGGAAALWSWLLGAVVPILLFALAWLSSKERWGQRARKDAGNLPETRHGQKQERSGTKDWRTLPRSERVQLAGLSTSEIVAQYDVSERTARNWRSRSQGAVRSESHAGPGFPGVD